MAVSINPKCTVCLLTFLLAGCQEQPNDSREQSNAAPSENHQTDELIVLNLIEFEGQQYQVSVAPADVPSYSKRKSVLQSATGKPVSPDFLVEEIDIADLRFRLVSSDAVLPDSFWDTSILRNTGAFPSEGELNELFERAAYEQFILARAECADAVQTLGRSQIEKKCLVSADGLPESIRGVVGVLAAVGSPSPFCGATIVSSQAIVTARHCFWEQDGSGRRSTHYDRLKDGQVSFIPLVPGSGPRSVKVAKDALSGVAPYIGDTTTDVVELALTEALSSPVAIPTSPPEPPFSGFMVGPYPSMEIAMGRRHFSHIEYVQANTPDLCVAVYFDDQGCWYHSCQTVASTSGSGFLVELDDERVGLVAVHSGPSNSHEPCDADGYEADLLSGPRLPNGRWPLIGFNVGASVESLTETQDE